jgi:hypothetical protein
MGTIGKFHDTVKKRTDDKIALTNTIEWSLVTLINICLLILVMALKHKEDAEKPVTKKKVVRKKRPVRKKPVSPVSN